MNDPNYRELVERCNGKFVPRSLDDFIGAHSTAKTSGARAVATIIERAVRMAKANGNSPLKFLLNGPPGIGKSALTLYAQHLLGCDKWTTRRLNGTQVKIELVESLAGKLHYKSLYGDYQLILIDEADEIPRVAQVRLLTLLDELPDSAAVICTSNCPLKNFENRFQTRFQVFDLAGPQSDEIEKLIARFLNNPAAIKQIATLACGNVRQALLDVQGVLQAAS
jgi:replication-associated recombination protein RarA